MLETLKEWDFKLFIYLNNSGIEALDGFWIYVTNTLFWTPLFILIIYLVYRAYGVKKGTVVMAYYITAIAVNLTLMLTAKYYFSRIRPSSIPELEELIRALYSPSGYSFYSGHASNSFVIVTFAVLALKKYYKWIYVLFIFPLLFTMSRIFVGVHYPSDLFIGALAGTLIAFVFYKRYVFSITDRTCA